MKKKIIIIIAAAVVIAAAILAGMKLFNTSKLNKGVLKSARWGYGGGMTGGHSSVEIRLEGDKAILVTEEQEWHNSDLTIVTYTLPADVMDKLKDLIIDADVPTLSKRGMSDIFAYDAATYSFSCYFEGVDYYSVSQNQKKSGAEADKLYAIRTYLYSLAQQNEGVTEIIKGTAQDDN